MKGRRRQLIALLAAASAAGVFLVLGPHRPTSRAIPQARPAPAGGRAPGAHASETSDQPSYSNAASIDSRSVAVATSTRPGRASVPSSDDNDSASSPATLDDVLSRHRPIAAKAVPLGEEREALEALVSDPGTIALARDRLLEAPAGPGDQVSMLGYPERGPLR